MKRTLWILLCAFGCSANNSGTGRTGPVELRLVDAPADDVTQIVVTITGVSAHVAGGGWQQIADQTLTVDLLTLQGGSFATLGVTTLPAGTLTQIRLNVTDAGPNYVTTSDGVQHPLTVPSGDESGLKIIGQLNLTPCDQGAVTFDFDGKHSIFTHPTGHGDEWILRPVIRLKSVETNPGACDTADAGTPAAPDAGPVATPPSTCDNVTCPDGQACVNGACESLVP